VALSGACTTAVAFVLTAVLGSEAGATVIFGNDGLALGARWDAAARSVPELGERSLDGGLRYSVQGGSYEAYRDLFSWRVVPSVDEFQAAVEAAFAAWTAVDPETGLGTLLAFTPDFVTAVMGPSANVGVDLRGAEIDLLAYSDAILWNPGDAGQRGETFFMVSDLTTLMLTSGTTGYLGYALNGADIKLNNNPQALYDLDIFQYLLTHEIGHAIGLGDVDFPPTSVSFIDDNFDGTSAATAQATLTNSWALLVDVSDPSASPLALYAVANGTPGLDTPGVSIMMESQFQAALRSLPVLQNDDFGGRQFLYPLPEPGTLVLLASGLLGLAPARRA